MANVSIIGAGQTPVREHWSESLVDLASRAIRAALADAGLERADALFVGNMLSGELTGQQHLGALVADHAGLPGVEAIRVEAACASGAASLRAACAAVEAGYFEHAIVVGVEKMTDRAGPEVTAALASAANADFEADHGLSFVALNALLMRRYMHEHGVSHAAFAPFVINAHTNALGNEDAMLHLPVTPEMFASAKMVADPVNLLDSAPVCDGAAALVLRSHRAARCATAGARAVAIRSVAMATDTLAVHDRRDPLRLAAIARSAGRALEEANLTRGDLDLFEVHDAFSIMTVLSLEASGFAAPGQGTRLGASGAISLRGELPISTLGGLKARGHPVGASGIYQVVEAVRQLRGEAGANQVPGARLGMTQNIGGSGATVVTTILESRD
jgi:acetyl-CoA C-acetyltransferase